jgi:cytochrome c oxidase subunit IV
MPAWTLFGPLGAFPQLVLMAAGGMCSLVAIFRQRERAVLAFAGLVPLLLVLVFVVAELALPH